MDMNPCEDKKTTDVFHAWEYSLCRRKIKYLPPNPQKIESMLNAELTKPQFDSQLTLFIDILLCMKVFTFNTAVLAPMY